MQHHMDQSFSLEIGSFVIYKIKSPNNIHYLKSKSQTHAVTSNKRCE
uniref:Uncharacterized protein n=1 Tax=Anguilla anguilla TaxID=7936 RepID=A0A0E9SK58_ANGAN